MKSLLLIALLLGLVAGARAQTTAPTTPQTSAQITAQITDDKPTLQERMRHSISKQLDAASRMQGSLERQKLASAHQTGQTAGAGFFALPKPASLGPPVYRSAAPLLSVPATEPAVEQMPEKDEKQKDEKDEMDDIPPPGLIPFDPALLEPLKPILPVPGIESPVRILKGTKGTALNTPKMEELLRGLGAQGIPGLLRGQSEANPAYSGRESAPLTSFSLMDWLFGL